MMLFLMAFAAVADPLTVGAPMPELELPDQHEKMHVVADANTILFAPNKAAGEIVHQSLGQGDSQSLKAKGIVYISDISGMPSFVTRMFALPKMRDYPYPVLLGYDKAETAMFPRREGQVTVLGVVSGKIERIDFAESAAALNDLVEVSEN